MPEPAEPVEPRVTALLAALADGTPVDWDAEESRASNDDEREAVRRLSRIGHAVVLQRRAAAAVRAADAPGSTWKHLEIREKIGEGAFGNVYRAHEPKLARDVALKLLREPLVVDETRTSAAIREGQLLARVRHNNVVIVHGADSLDGQVGIWTEFVDGKTLYATVIDQGPLSVDEVTRIGIDLSRALAAVHDAGLLHRDIKAQNVMRENTGRIVLMDFGTGRDLALASGRRRDVSGTPLYLAPELFDGGEASVASDIYALSVLLFFLLTGKYPVSGHTLNEVREAHQSGVRTPLRELRPEVPDALAGLIERGLELDSARRFLSARDFEQALQPPAEAFLDSGAASGRRRSGAVITAASVLVLIGVAWWIWARLSGRQSAPPPASAVERKVASEEHPAPPAKGDAPSITLGTPPEVGSMRTAVPTAVAPTSGLEGTSKILLADYPYTDASISPDGRWLVEPHEMSGDLAIRDLATMKVNRLGLKNGGWESAGGADYPVLSRDRKRVAYRWTGEARTATDPNWAPPAVWTTRAQLGVIDLPIGTGRRPRLLVDDPDTTVLFVHDWSKNGDSVLVTLAGKSSLRQLAWVSVSDGRVTPLKAFDSRTVNVNPTAVRLSPDGRWIAYAANDFSLSASWFIYLLAADASQHETTLVRSAAINRDPIWSPSGTRLFYTSDVSGHKDLHSVEIRDDSLPGSDVTVVRNIGDGNILGLTKDGSLFYRSYAPGSEQIFLASVASQPQLHADIVGSGFVGLAPRFSPSGGSLAFLRRGSQNLEVLVRSMTTHTETPVNSRGSLFPSLWLTEHTLLEKLDSASDHPELVDVTTATTKMGIAFQASLLRAPTGALSADGKTLYNLARPLPRQPFGRFDRLVAFDLNTGRSSEIWQVPPDLATANFLDVALALSPNGRDLAIAIRSAIDRKARLFTIGVDGQGYRELTEPYPTDETHEKVAWTESGVFFSETSEPQGDVSWRLMRIDPKGGEAQALVTIHGRDSGAGFDVSRDGSWIAIHPDRTATQSFSDEAGPRNALSVYYLPGPSLGKTR